MSDMSTCRVRTPAGAVEVTITEQGEGTPVLLLHGGAGPVSVEGFGALLAAGRPARVVTPVHPGFAGTPRPAHLSSIRALAATYTALLDELDLTGVTVVGNSIGGWAAAEIALLGSPRVAGVVLVDAVGLSVEAHPIVDFFALTMDQVADLSFYEPDRFRLDVDALPAAARAMMMANRDALLAYGGTAMADPTLLDRLTGIRVPTLVVWGAADRVVVPEHGRLYADRIAGAELDIIDTAGHLPQLETPQRLVEDIWAFVARA